MDEFFLPPGSCTGNQGVFWYCFFFFVFLVVFALIMGPLKNRVDYGAIVYSFTNIISINSAASLSIRIYNLYFIFDNVYEQLVVAFLGTVGFILAWVDEEPTVTFYVCVVTLTNFYYFVTNTHKKMGVFLLIDQAVAIAVAVIIFNRQPYAEYIVFIASSIPRIMMYIYREGKKIADQELIISQSFVDRFRLACYLISWLAIATVFTYPFRFLAVIVRAVEKPAKFFEWYVFMGVVLLAVLAGLAEKMGSLIAYGMLVTLGLIYRDYVFDNPHDYVFYLFEFLFFWIVCVPIFFEANTFFPVLFLFTSFYGVALVGFGGVMAVKDYWEKSELILHFTEFSLKGYSLGFVMTMTGGGCIFLALYGYQYFASLIGQWISF